MNLSRSKISPLTNRRADTVTGAQPTPITTRTLLPPAAAVMSAGKIVIWDQANARTCLADLANEFLMACPAKRNNDQIVDASLMIK